MIYSFCSGVKIGVCMQAAVSEIMGMALMNGWLDEWRWGYDVGS
jgi:hypothetical protein